MNYEKIFRRDDFRSVREWLYFCVEYDLQICEGCQECAKRVDPAEQRSGESWRCGECRPSMHRDLWRAIRLRENVSTECGLCGATLPIRECWISLDCRRLYCASHLKTIEPAHREHLAARAAAGGTPPPAGSGAGPAGALAERRGETRRLLERIHELRRSLSQIRS